ncbi:MAG: potassium channel family protein [Thermodesulfobacteriota bacterium]
MRMTARQAQPWVTLLLAGLLLLHPFVTVHQGAFLFVLASLGSVFLSISRRNRTQRFLFYAFGALLAGSLFLNIQTAMYRSVLYLLCTMTHFFFIFIVISELLKTRDITKNEIFGLINCYLIVATVFSFIYEIASFSDPHALAYSHEFPHDHTVFLYFSFVTITTLGYGDVTPLSPLMRNVAIIEAIFGQFYIAIVVAYILSRYVQRKSA